MRFPLHSRPPGLLRLVHGFPTLPGGASLPRLLPVLRRHRLAPLGDPMFRHCGTSERDVGHQLMSLHDLIDHSSWSGGCISREGILLQTMTVVSDALPTGGTLPRLDIWFQAIQLYPYHADLATPHLTASSDDHRFLSRLLFPLGFPIR